MNDSWSSGNPYEMFMGRWSTLVAAEFLSWMAVPAKQSWLDLGCGTGSLSKLILEDYAPAEVIGADASSEFIAHAQQRITDPRAHFLVSDARSLELDANSVDALVSGLMLNFVPQPEEALADMQRVVKPEGRIGIFLWDYAEGMQMLRYFWDAAVELDADASEFDEGIRFPLCAEGQLEALVREAGLKDVEAAPIEATTVFKDFDDYWQPFLGKVGPAPAYVMSLDEENRRKLREKLRLTLPTNDDGSIELKARAWVVKATP